MKTKVDRSKDLLILVATVAVFGAMVGWSIYRDIGRQEEKNRRNAYDRQGDEQLRQMREKVARYQGQSDAERQADFDREQQDNQR